MTARRPPVPLVLLLLLLLLLGQPRTPVLASPSDGPPGNHSSGPAVLPPRLGPTPPRQTPVMELQMKNVHAAAGEASAAARPRLLQLLAEPGFEVGLGGCCPELAAMQPSERLAWFDRESTAAEMVHNFGRSQGDMPSQFDVIMDDESIELGLHSEYFHNLWEIELLSAEQGPPPPFPGVPPPPPPAPPVVCSSLRTVASCENVTRDKLLQQTGQTDLCKWRTATSQCVDIPAEQTTAQTTDIVEVGLFGFPAFENPNASKQSSDDNIPLYSFAEAINRPIYTAFNHRKVDVGNPMFGHTCAVFAPNYVRNMTLIAPVDTGAWDPACNTSLQSKFQREQGSCNAANESACNDDAPQRISCDWRHGICTDATKDRQLCKHQATETTCNSATGIQRDTDMFNSGKAITSNDWWNLLLSNSGCSWSSEAQRCTDFQCAQLTTEHACNASSNASSSMEGQPKKCTWTDSMCKQVTPDIFCNDTHKWLTIGGPPMPGIDPKTQCESPTPWIKGLCQFVPPSEHHRSGANVSGGGHCVPVSCNDMTVAQQCHAHGQSASSTFYCAWDVNSKSCIEYDGNCTLLPDKNACKAQQGCVWGITNTSEQPVCHAGPGHRTASFGGEQFNCSFEHWKYPDQLALGTPTHYYHILEAGVSIWADNSSSVQLGTLFGRMAAPHHFNITSAEVFKYWEANIAGNPIYPDAIKMMVGSFGELFGTSLGEVLQKWCKKRGWILAWALGNPGDTYGMSKSSAPYANRTLDPTVFGYTTAKHNMTLAGDAIESFVDLWTRAAASRNNSNSTIPNPYDPMPINVSLVYSWWNQLDNSLSLDFLDGESCADVNACVGVRSEAADPSKPCVCYRQ